MKEGDEELSGGREASDGGRDEAFSMCFRCRQRLDSAGTV